MRSRRSGDAVEPAVELEVLERGQLAVDERLVREEAEAPAVERDLELAGGRDREPRAKAQQRRLPGSVGPGDEQEPAGLDVELDAAQNALVAVALRKPACPDHDATVVAPGQNEQRHPSPSSHGEDSHVGDCPGRERYGHG